MSVFRIVGNYYEDVLDYYTREYKKLDPAFDPSALQEEYLKFQADPSRSTLLTTFRTKFEGLFNLPADQTAKKTEIIQNLASAFARVHRLYQSTWSYWNARQKVFRTMMIVMIIMIVITFIILIYMIRIRMRYPKGGDDVISADNLQSMLLYLIVYTIFFTVMLMLLLMMVEGMRMSSARKKDNNMRFTNFNVMLIPNIHMMLFLQAIGYYMQNNTGEYIRVFNQLQSGIKRSGGGGTKKCGKNATTKIVDIMISKNPCKKQANLSDLYDSLKFEIRDFVFQFYNYGYGYVTLKKAVIKSNNAYILKEVRKIFAFYYYLFNKRGEYDVERSMLESNQKILDNVVVTKFRELGLSYFIASEGTDDVTIQDMNEDTSKNPRFTPQAILFENSIKHLLIYIYPLYLKALPNSSEFTTLAPVVSAELPTRISQTTEFERRTKAFFDNFSQEIYTEYIDRMKSATPQEKQILFNLFLQKFDTYIESEMTSLLLVVEGASTFPLNDDYIQRRLDNVMENSIVTQTNESYRTMFQTAFMEHLIPVIRKNILNTIETVDVSKGINSVVNYKIHILSNQLANELADYNINVMENLDYVVEKLDKDNIDQRLLNIYTKVMYGLDGVIDTKRKMRRSSAKAAAQGRFISTAEFITRLNTITYDDVYKGLDTKYAYDILNDFYMEVSHASGTSGIDRTEQNIFYQQMKNFRMSRTLIIMVTIIIIMGYIYYVIPQIKIWNKLSNAPEPETATGEVIRSINHVNIAAKTLIPLVAMVFVIVLLFSYHSKSVHKFNFNKETIETNTSYLLSSLTKLDSLVGKINKAVDSKRYAAIGDIQEIKEEDKTDMYKYMMNVIEQYEKCNYIINVSRNKIPFPYTELTVDIFMMGVSLMAIVYLTMKIGPIARLEKIKELNKKREDAIIMTVSSLKEVADKEKVCNTEDVEAIVFTIKVIVFTAIFLFLIFYTVTILESATEFKMGLYNSVYFEESRCYTGHD
jgi:hypothetical protein